MKLSYDLTIEQTQKLVMTPELVQAIKILQLNMQDLESYVEEQLLCNPILEIDENSNPSNSEENNAGEKEEKHEMEDSDFDWSEYLEQREYDDISYRQHEYSAREVHDDSPPFEGNQSTDVSLSEHLMFQLQFSDISQKRKAIGRYIIESLDDNGYLNQNIMDIGAYLNVPDDKVAEVLKLIQSFDPSGVAARNLQESLLIQVRNLGEDTDDVLEIIENHLEDLANNRISYIANKVGIDILEVQEIGDLIKMLEPKPGREFNAVIDNNYVTPDVLVDKVGNDYIVSLNDSRTPRLRVSSYYRQILKNEENDSQISQFLNDRLNSALWLIKSIEQRRQTIYNVVSAVISHQRDFFDLGPKYMKPLTLKNIADEVGIHESTVSRSINGKYMQTPRGVFEIKYFFSGGVGDNRDEGIASNSIKLLIEGLIEDEDEKKPLSDQKISEALKNEGIDISRRTVSKYRSELGILSSSKRKRY